MQTESTELLRRCRFLKVVFRRWGIQRKVALPPPPNADAKRFKHSKSIIVSEEYDQIVAFQNEVNGVVKRYSMPSFVFPGVVAVANGGVEDLDKILRDKQALLPGMVEKLTDRLPSLIEDAREALNGQFSQKDYPPVEDVARRFAIRWQWIQFDVPDGLPANLREAEAKKLKEQFEQAQEEIIGALRQNFSEIVSAMVDRLRSGPDGKTKIFRDSLVENFKEFFDTFGSRNLMDDAELAVVVEQAKGLLNGVTPGALRDSTAMREKVAADMAKVKASLDTMLTERPGRKFDLED
jgi:molybdopterin converting factor small subunit